MRNTDLFDEELKQKKNYNGIFLWDYCIYNQSMWLVTVLFLLWKAMASQGVTTWCLWCRILFVSCAKPAKPYWSHNLEISCKLLSHKCGKKKKIPLVFINLFMWVASLRMLIPRTRTALFLIACWWPILFYSFVFGSFPYKFWFFWLRLCIIQPHIVLGWVPTRIIY